MASTSSTSSASREQGRGSRSHDRDPAQLQSYTDFKQVADTSARYVFKYVHLCVFVLFVFICICVCACECVCENIV